MEELERKKTTLPKASVIQEPRYETPSSGVQTRVNTKHLRSRSSRAAAVNHEEEEGSAQVKKARTTAMKHSPRVVLAKLPSSPLPIPPPRSRAFATERGPHAITSYMKKYPRFSASITSSVCALEIKSRPLSWLFRLMEEIYDEYYHVSDLSLLDHIESPVSTSSTCDPDDDTRCWTRNSLARSRPCPCSHDK